jgi:hypothetical protein
VSAWAALLRRSRRLARRSPARTASTGALIVLAVAAATLFLSVTWGDFRRDQAVEQTYGTADARYWLDQTRWPEGQGVSAAAVVMSLPEGSEAVVIDRTTNIGVESGEAVEVVTASAAPWDDPLLAGVLNLVDGSAPGAGEVVIPPEHAERAGVDIGDRLTVTGSGTETELEISGIGTVGPRGWGSIAVAPGALPPADAGQSTTLEVFVALPDDATAPTLPATAEQPFAISPMLPDAEDGTILQPGPLPLRTLTGILGLAALGVAATAGAAFGIGAARRRRAAGILSANGADARLLRVATSTEALVVALPAAVLGVALGAAMPPLWITLRWPQWPLLVDATLPWPWVAGLLVVAVLAAVLGALVTGRALSSSSASALLDERPARRSPRRARLGAGWFVVFGLVGAWVLSFVGRLAAVSGVAVLVGALAWILLSAIALVVGGQLLRRDVIGRLVANDLRRRPVGSIAAVSIVAIWVFLAVVGTATEGFRFPAEQVPSSGVDGPTGAGVLIRPLDGAAALPSALASDLADAGLVTSALVVQHWTGECAACPTGWVPTVGVLDSTDNTGLPAPTVADLHAGAAVTGWSVGSVEGSSVAGVPVRNGPVALGVDAVVLRSSIGDGEGLIDPQAGLIADTAGLTPRQVADVAMLLRSADVRVTTWDPRLEPRLVEVSPAVSDDASGWLLVGLLVLLVLVTLAATAAHRREHGEAAWVLRVLGAGPRSGRRLASITAGSLATIGVALGLGAALLTIAGSAARNGEQEPLLGLWNRTSTAMVLGALVVPVVIAAMARLIPPYRSPHDPCQLGPA